MKGKKWAGMVLAFSALLIFAPYTAGTVSDYVTNLGPKVNSAASDFAPVISPDGNFLYFTSDREGGMGNQDIWVSERVDGVWTEPVNLGPPINDLSNQGPDSVFTADGKEYLYLTLCNFQDAGLCDIYISEKNDDGTWTKPDRLDFPVNTEYSDANASWDYINNTLYFTSTRPGGIPGDGGVKKRPDEASYDIWRVKLKENGKWDDPENLGEPINTDGWEGVAFYHAADSTLYFSSNGHGGLGGADVFKSKEVEPGKWSTPMPIEELNSAGNDIYFSVPATGDVAYFSSNAATGEGEEDIYSVPLNLILSRDLILARMLKLPARKIALEPFENIYFDFDEAGIRASEQEKLQKLIDTMNQNLGLNIELAGHTDAVGELDYNLVLSRQRAEQVKKYLMDNKINPNRVSVTYHGESQPVAEVDPVKGNPLNRRVEIHVR